MGIYPNSPCKDCADRIPGCHSQCDNYKEWQAIKEERKNKVQKARENMKVLDEFLIGNKKKIRDRTNGGRK